MASNPLIPQGRLNRVRGTIVVPAFPALNITASFLGKAGISLAFEGEGVNYIDTMAGAVTSPAPYIMCTVTANLLKTQPLANLYEAQRIDSSVLGDITVKGDATTLQDYTIINTSIQQVRELSFAGEDAGYVVMLHGYYNINNSLWNL